MRARPRTVVVAVAAALTLSACGGGPETEPGSQPDGSPPAERPSSTAELRIVEPAPGDRTDGESVPVVLELEGARIIEEVSTDLQPDEGHIHLALDGESLTLLGGLEEDLAELAGGPLEPGQHILEAEFVAADHGFFLPRVIETTTFFVE